MTDVLVVDVANLLGSRPDGWWRDRAGATRRLLDRLAAAGLGEVVAAGARRIVVVRAIRDAADPEAAARELRAALAAEPEG